MARLYDTDRPEDAIGSRHPAEHGYLLPHEDGFPEGALDSLDINDTDAFMRGYIELKQQLNIPDTCGAPEIAARMSVDPTALGTHTQVEGGAVLAMTECGRRYGYPPSALHI